MANLSRRLFLRGAATAAALGGVAAPAGAKPLASIDAFLATACATERAWYLATTLAETMNEIEPGRWFAFVREEDGEAGVINANHDVAPLLADDATGTTAFADWNAWQSAREARS